MYSTKDKKSNERKKGESEMSEDGEKRVERRRTMESFDYYHHQWKGAAVANEATSCWKPSSRRRQCVYRTEIQGAKRL
jgi:hypothetical protein